jgi:galactarate dehydratase
MAHNVHGQIVGNAEEPRVIRMHADDNVAIVANDFGLPAGAQLPSGPALRERVPQGHKVALVDLAEGAPVRRYNVVIGYAAQTLPAGSWVNEQSPVMPTPLALEGLPIATKNAPLGPPLDGYTFEGYRNSEVRWNTQSARQNDDRAVRLWRRRACRVPDPRRAAPAVPQCRRRGRP